MPRQKLETKPKISDIIFNYCEPMVRNNYKEGKGKLSAAEEQIISNLIDRFSAQYPQFSEESLDEFFRKWDVYKHDTHLVYYAWVGIQLKLGVKPEGIFKKYFIEYIRRASGSIKIINFHKRREKIIRLFGEKNAEKYFGPLFDLCSLLNFKDHIKMLKEDPTQAVVGKSSTNLANCIQASVVLSEMFSYFDVPAQAFNYSSQDFIVHAGILLKESDMVLCVQFQEDDNAAMKTRAEIKVLPRKRLSLRN